LLSGANYDTGTKLDTLICNGCTWLEGSLSASAWHGQSIKLKFLRSSGSIAIDRVRTVNVAAGGWEFTGGAPSLTSFSGNPTLSGLIGLTTPALYHRCQRPVPHRHGDQCAALEMRTLSA
jgi:hypothetical protein